VPVPTNVLKFEVAAFMEEITAAAEVAKDASGIVRLYVGPKTIRVVAKAEGMGSFEGQIDASGDKEGRIALNASYVLDALGVLHTTFGTIGLRSQTEPVLIQPVGDDTDFSHIIMPMIVEWE
jgi:DNA polymerase III sliding clamp (beta) subunit (PCNA family)